MRVAGYRYFFMHGEMVGVLKFIFSLLGQPCFSVLLALPKSHWLRVNMKMKISHKQALPLQTLKIPDSQILLKQCWKKSTWTHVLLDATWHLPFPFFSGMVHTGRKRCHFFVLPFLMTLIASVKALVSVVGASLLILTCHDTTANWDACRSGGAWRISCQGCRGSCSWCSPLHRGSSGKAIDSSVLSMPHGVSVGVSFLSINLSQLRT